MIPNIIILEEVNRIVEIINLEEIIYSKIFLYLVDVYMREVYNNILEIIIITSDKVLYSVYISTA